LPPRSLPPPLPLQLVPLLLVLLVPLVVQAQVAVHQAVTSVRSLPSMLPTRNMNFVVAVAEMA
jgi:hypothetical protein